VFNGHGANDEKGLHWFVIAWVSLLSVNFSVGVLGVLYCCVYDVYCSSWHHEPMYIEFKQRDIFAFFNQHVVNVSSMVYLVVGGRTHV